LCKVTWKQQLWGESSFWHSRCWWAPPTPNPSHSAPKTPLRRRGTFLSRRLVISLPPLLAPKTPLRERGSPHHVDEVEHGKVEGYEDSADRHTHEGDEERLEQTRECVDRVVDFLVVELGNFVQH